ncbi:MAG: ABC transporter permease [Gammaproteobacteria bacterium]|nr:ABC transporter permease [Gammaproteobacteria bacterium]
MSMAAIRPNSGENPIQECHIRFSQPSKGTLLIQFTGHWTLQNELPSVNDVEKQLGGGGPIQCVSFDTQALTGWDSGLLAYLIKIIDECKTRNIKTDQAGLPDGVRRLLDLAYAVPEREGARGVAKRPSLLARIGTDSINVARGTAETVSFIGEATLAIWKFLRGKARYRHVDFTMTIQQCGPQALPIITLISFLVGVILAYIGAVQLEQFGAEIYVANLVGLAMAREMGAMMTAIIMAGRTGGAFAAQLGTMTVNEEIDALKTMGVSPMEFLVLPRMLALMLMLPVLCLYSDLLGILGGAAVSISILDLGVLEYFNQTKNAIHLHDFAGGLFKSAVYGTLVAIAGCLRGMQSGRSAAAVGDAATSAVVTAIVWIVVASAITTVIYNILGI